MNKSLFQIEQSMYNLLNYGVDDETGEYIDDPEQFYKLYDSIQLDLNTKLDNTNCLNKMLDGEIEVIDKEIERLKKEKARRERTKIMLTNRVDSFVRNQCMNEDGSLNKDKLAKFKLALPHSSISYRKSTSVLIDDESLIPDKFKHKEVTYKIDKNEIKKALKTEDVAGCSLHTNYNIKID